MNDQKPPLWKTSRRIAATLACASTLSSAQVRILFDTDYSTDCDDPGALAVLHALADNGEAVILATGASTLLAKAPGAIDVVNTYYGRPDIPIAATKVPTAPNIAGKFAAFLHDNFPHNTPLTAEVPDAVATYREILAAQPDDSVVFVTVGYLTNVAELLKSGPDAHSPLNGVDLVAAKVKEWACMGGNFWTTSTDNVNFSRDTASAQYAIGHFPKKITFIPREVASVPSPLRAGEELNETPLSNPVRIAYHKYFERTTNIDRHCADLATVLCAVRGIKDYWDIESTGSMTNILSNGTFTWDVNGTQDHNYLVMKGGYNVYSNKAYVEGVLRNLLKQAPANAPVEPPPPDPGPLPVRYSFSAVSGTFVNRGSGGPALNLTNTGGLTGRNNTGSGGLGATGPDGFGTAFDVLASGDGSYHSSTSATGGGALSAQSVPQSLLQGADGAFTYEALISLGTLDGEQNILSHDGNPTRGFLFAVLNGQLRFYSGSTSFVSPIPGTGDHAFSANAWFHVAVTYSGEAGSPGNLRLYWSALSATPGEANLIGSHTLSDDLSAGAGNFLGVGTTTRDPFRYELRGRVDEVRIHRQALAADAFAVFTPPGTPLQVWRFEHFGTTAAEGDAADDADPDEDGADNLKEFQSGTLPLDPLSVLRLLPGGIDDGGFAIRIHSVNGKTYQVEKSPTLLPEAWQAHGASLAGNGGELEFSAPLDEGFYRVAVAP